MSDAIHAWDLGGANVKLACANPAGEIDYVSQQALALWKQEDDFTRCIETMLQAAPQRHVRHVMTMTGELADCFPDRRTGVAELLRQFCKAVGTEDIAVFSGTTSLAGPDEALRCHEQTASANWLASAAFLQGELDNALFMDMGSTTTDILLVGKENALQVATDAQRLRSGQLLYLGAIRTPLSNVVDRLPLRGHFQALMNEYFANTGDALFLMRDVADEVLSPWTADGGDVTEASSHRRIARMLGLDARELEEKELALILAYVREQFLGKLFDSVMQVLSQSKTRPEQLIVAGVGKTLLSALGPRLDLPCTEFSALFPGADLQLHDAISDCAPVAALTQIARI